MPSDSKPDGKGLNSEPRGQRLSMSGERTSSMSGTTTLAAPLPVSPEPAYIAASAASQIITTDRQTQTDDWFDERADKGDFAKVTVSPGSLTLVNAFLDQLLYSFLANARSTSIAALRPAVSEILKPRLAKEAINGADQELEEFLGGGDEEELSAFHNGLEYRGPWDLHLVWRRSRLRCMVYTRLGDFEEEDEEAYVERERAEADDEGQRRLSRDLGMVSPAAAIFLTSILEFVGEQVLVVAGEAAYARQEAKTLKELSENALGSSEGLYMNVEESDMEKLAFNTTFGRLWRSWRKRVRSPSMLSTRTMSRDFGLRKGSVSPTSHTTSRKASFSEPNEVTQEISTIVRPSVAQVLERPLETDPISTKTPDQSPKKENRTSSAHADDESSIPSDVRRRPRSMVFYPQPIDKDIDSNFSKSTISLGGMQRHRSFSLPALQPVLDKSPFGENLFAPNSYFRTAQFTNGDEVSSTVRSMRISSYSSGSSSDAISRTPTTDKLASLEKQLQSRPSGMGKEEFDRHMLAMVRDTESPPTGSPSLHSSDRSLASQDAPELSQVQPNRNATSVVGEDISGGVAASHPSNSRRSFRDQMDYASEADDSSQDRVSLPSEQLDAKGGENLSANSTQGGRPRTASGSTDEHEYGRIWEHQAPYSYHGPVASHTNNYARIPRTQSVELQEVTSPHVSADDNGVPPLTPLRELVEAAHDTSDEASSIAPSYEASKVEHVAERFQGAKFPRSEPFSQQVLPQAKPASKLSDLRSKLPAVNTGTERAAVQRVLPSPVSAREPLTPILRTSSSSNRDLRPIHTSSSSASQVSVSQKLKGLVGRDSSDGRRPTMSRRSSEGSSSMASDKRSLRTPKADEAQRTFDQLIKSDETLQYTLTPQNMRDMEAAASPRWNSHKRSDTTETADFYRNTGPEDPPRPSTSRSIISLKGLNGLAANPVKITKIPEQTSDPPTAHAAPVTNTAKTSSRPTTSHSHSGVPRGARSHSESTRDFADFLRSTGPSEMVADAQAQQPKGPPVAAPKPLNTLPTVTRPTSGHGQKKITKQNPSGIGHGIQQPLVNGAGHSKHVGPIAPKDRTPKLQAREPTVPRETTADLIDFIRQGPTDRADGRLRLPRTGDPARPFGDINGLTRGINGRPSEDDKSRLSVASTQMSSVPSKSVHSVNSRTGLLDSGSPTRDTSHRVSESIDSQSGRLDDPPRPVRKQHRNKDPYTIDTDSEDDDDVPPRKEESLIEFLNSVKPPSSPAGTGTALASVSNSNQSSAPLKNQYPSMRDRLSRNGVARAKPAPKEMGVPSITRGKVEARQATPKSTQGRGPTSPPLTTSMSGNRSKTELSQGNRARSQAPQLPPLNPRETSPHLISQVGSKMDSYRITQPTYAAHVDRERNGAARRTPTQHHQARGNREPDHGLSDLADFLKNSEPPTTPARVDSPPVKDKEKDGGFGRMFSRRRKNSQA